MAVTRRVCRQASSPQLGLLWVGLSRWGDVVVQPEQVAGSYLFLTSASLCKLSP